MTAPAPTARTTPTKTPMKNGYQTLITFAADADVGLWEKTVQPFGLEGGDAVDTTTMHNTTVRSKAARTLIDVTEATFTAAYAKDDLAAIMALINVETTVTYWMPGGGSWAAFGYLKSAVPQEHQEGEQPEMQCTVVFTNIDPASGDEEVPVYTAPA